jgi:hypothetical protein
MSLFTIKRLVASLLALAAIVGMLTVGTHALFTDSTANTGNTVDSGELTAPSLSQPTASGGSVPLSWTAATLPGNASHEDEITYTVERKLGSGSFGAAGGTCTGSLSTSSCTDSLSTGGTYTYRIIAHFRSWTTPSNERTVTVALGGGPAAPTTVALANGGGVGNAYINDANEANLSVEVGLPASSVATNTVHVVITDGAAHSTVDKTTAATTGAGTATVTGIDASGLDDGSVTIHATASNGSGTSPETTQSATKDTVKPTSQVEPVTSITSGNTFTVPYTSADASPSSTLEKVDLYVDPPGGGTFSLTDTDSSPSASGESFTYTGAATDGAYGFYTRATDNAGNVEDAPGGADQTATKTTAAATPPTVTAAVIAKTDGLPNSAAGFVRAFAGNLGTYKVYANATAGSNSISTVTASLTHLGGGAAVSLSTCSSDCTVNGVTYSHVSGTQTPAATGAGSVGFAVTATDTASSTHTLNGAVTVDNTAPMGNTIATADTAGNTGSPQAGDTMTFGYTESMDGISFLNTWFWPWTTVADVRVTITSNSSGNDTLQITDNGGTALPFGTINLGDDDYSDGAAGTQTLFGATGTTSKIALSGSTVTITLGTASGAAVGDQNGNRTITWTPATGTGTFYDRAGNRMGANTPPGRTSAAGTRVF